MIYLRVKFILINNLNEYADGRISTSEGNTRFSGRLAYWLTDDMQIENIPQSYPTQGARKFGVLSSSSIITSWE